MEKIKDVLKRYEGYGEKWADVEVYKPNTTGKHYPNHFHTDNCSYTEDWTEDSYVKLVDLMDEEDYNNTVQANCDSADFEEWFGDKNAKILCMMLAD